MSLLETSTIWVCPDPYYCRGRPSQPWRRSLTCLPDLQVTRPFKGGKERGASHIGNFRNNNKHNIPPIIIPLPPVSITFSTASESLNLSSSTVPHRLHHQNCNAVAVSPSPQIEPPLPKSDTISAAILWPLLIKNPVLFLAKKISSPTGMTWKALQCVRWHQNTP